MRLKGAHSTVAAWLFLHSDACSGALPSILWLHLGAQAATDEYIEREDSRFEAAAALLVRGLEAKHQHSCTPTDLRLGMPRASRACLMLLGGGGEKANLDI
jgi:hypothetical protein